MNYKESVTCIKISPEGDDEDLPLFVSVINYHDGASIELALGETVDSVTIPFDQFEHVVNAARKLIAENALVATKESGDENEKLRPFRYSVVDREEVVLDPFKPFANFEEAKEVAESYNRTADSVRDQRAPYSVVVW